jgi:O-antigen ligase
LYNNINMTTAFIQQDISFAEINKRFALAFILGVIDGLKVLPKELHIVAYVLVSISCVVSILKEDELRFFQLLPYLIYGELYVRDGIAYFPYNYLTYLSIVMFILLLVQQKITIGKHSMAFYFLVGYTILEFIDLFRAIDMQYAWMQFTNSFMLMLLVLWGSYNYFSAHNLNKFLINVQITCLFTCGYLAVAHFMGKINYGHSSNFGASNGLPPNQLSTYIGFPCILFAFAVLNSNKNFLTNLICLTASCILMTMTFSRGGIYFLIAFISVYFILNRNKGRTYKMLFILMPIGFAAYLYILGATNGMLEKRFEQSGYSGRDLLVKASVHLFLQHPLFGVGTSNFNLLIKEENLYDINSGAHNEITRAMAEHGILGIIFFWGFFVVLFFEILQRSKIQRDYSTYFLLLFLLSIIHNGLKSGLQCFILMLAVALPTVTVIKGKNCSAQLSQTQKANTA